MIVRTLAEAEKTDRRVVAENGNWQSVRLSLKEDKMGHSFNITTVHIVNRSVSAYLLSNNVSDHIFKLVDSKIFKIIISVGFIGMFFL